jgi:hypothetical protein
MKDYFQKQFDSNFNPDTGWAAGLDDGNNNSTNQDSNTIAKANLLTIPGLNPLLKDRLVFAYIWCRLANNAFAVFDARVNFYFHDEWQLSLPLLYAYTKAGLSNRFQMSAFTYSDTATPIIVPGSFALKLCSTHGQGANPPADEADSLIYLHPRPISTPVTRIQVDVIRWTNISPNNIRIILATKAE